MRKGSWTCKISANFFKPKWISNKSYWKDLESRIRCQNIRILGIPEGSEKGKHTKFVAGLILTLLGVEYFDLPVVVSGRKADVGGTKCSWKQHKYVYLLYDFLFFSFSFLVRISVIRLMDSDYLAWTTLQTFCLI